MIFVVGNVIIIAAEATHVCMKSMQKKMELKIMTCHVR